MRGLIKSWRNLRAQYAKAHYLPFLKWYGTNEKDRSKNKIPKDAANQIRFWLQKKKLSVVAEEAEVLIDAYKELQGLKTPKFKRARRSNTSSR